MVLGCGGSVGMMNVRKFVLLLVACGGRVANRIERETRDRERTKEGGQRPRRIM